MEEGEKLFLNVPCWQLSLFLLFVLLFSKVMLEGLFKTLGLSKFLFTQTIQILWLTRKQCQAVPEE